MLEDIAILTGGVVASEDKGMKLENLTIDMLGRADKISIDKENTTIVKGAGKKEFIQERIEQIKKLIENSTSDYDKEKLKERLAKLSGGVAVLYVGAASEVEMKEKKDRIDDALHATRAASEEGIVPGGGVAYIRAQAALEGLKGETEDETVSKSSNGLSKNRYVRLLIMPVSKELSLSTKYVKAKAISDTTPGKISMKI